MTETMQEVGRSDLQIRRHFEQQEQAAAEAHKREIAYAAWLVTNRTFRDEREALRARHGGYVTEQSFPRLPRSYFGEQTQPPTPDDRPARPFLFNDPPPATFGEAEASRDAVQAFQLFYRRWGLETFLTWDLPRPLQPELLGHTSYDRFTLSEAGVNLFLPWYMLKDQQVQLHEFARQLRRFQTPDHLQDWLEPSRGEAAALGYARLGSQFVLYRYWKLVLQARYGDRLRGNVERLQRAFAEYLEQNEDSVKKVRLGLASSLP